MISATFPPDVCGVGDYTAQLERALRHLGVHVDVVASNRANSGNPPERQPISSLFRRMEKWNVRAVVGLLKTVRKNGYNYIHIQYTPNFYGPLSFAVNLIPWLLLGSRCRTAVTFHEIYAPKLGGYKNRLLAFYDHFKDTMLLMGSSVSILTVPDRVARLGRRFPWLRSRLHAIPVGTGVRVVPMTIEERNAERARLGIGADDFLLGSFGTMHVDRHYDTLFRTLHRMIDRHPRLRFAIIGAYREEHPYYRFLKKWIADLRLDPYIVWTGYGNEEAVSRWLSLLDLYVMTDVRGASGRKSSLIAALGHGLPIVSTRGRDTPPDFIDGENMALVEVDDEQALSDRIERLVQDTTERNRLRAGASDLFSSCFAWESIAQETIEVYGFRV